MSQYLFIESRDPFDSHCHHYHGLASSLVDHGHQVVLFLVQNAVLVARPCCHSDEIKQLATRGITVLADDFSLKERGINQLIEGVKASPIDVVIDQLAAGSKVLWH